MDQKALDSITSSFKKEKIVHISVKEHTNIGAITGFFKEIIGDAKSKESDFTVNQRQKLSLEELKAVLNRVRRMVETRSGQTELIAEEIRRAIEIIGELMGEITPDDILNKIFSEFCVGK